MSKKLHFSRRACPRQTKINPTQSVFLTNRARRRVAQKVDSCSCLFGSRSLTRLSLALRDAPLAQITYCAASKQGVRGELERVDRAMA